LLLHHEINNIDIKYFNGFIAVNKIGIGIAIKFYKCYVIKWSSFNFLNKTQLKNIKYKIYIYIYILILMVLNLNIVDLIITIISWNK